ncbi:MAG: ribosomal protein S18-alanine N-acetyltransferase [Acidobacteria bacterium]|nr:ribosomal protein S18-alanine N-acetyltransferase [Acidobacteriota bacterium]
MKTPVTTYLSVLVPDDIPSLEKLEESVGLNFWGDHQYRRFLAEMPEYFGLKVTVIEYEGTQNTAGFLLARAVCETLEILKVGVLPEYQNLGIGTELMKAAYAEGMRRGCRRCMLEVRKSNENAIRFYHGQKFRVAGSRQDYYTNPVEDAWVMAREL